MKHPVSNGKTRILFVCLGNICRSAAAEEIMRSKVEELNLTHEFELDSAGLYGGHAGQRADKRMRVHAIRRGYDITHLARKVQPSDFDDFDIIVAMDNSNYDRLKEMAPTLEDEQKILKMTQFNRHIVGYDYIPDPYYEGAEGFELVLDLLEDATEGLLNTLIKQTKS